jgi:hypothetical protein
MSFTHVLSTKHASKGWNVMYLGEGNMGYLRRYPWGINYVMSPKEE